jgi:hypothetical protein
MGRLDVVLGLRVFVRVFFRFLRRLFEWLLVRCVVGLLVRLRIVVGILGLVRLLRIVIGYFVGRVVGRDGWWAAHGRRGRRRTLRQL